MITDKIKTIGDILKIYKPSKAEKDLISYKGRNSKIIGARSFMLAEIIAEILNEGTVLDWNNTNQRKWFGWYDYSTPGSGFCRSSAHHWLGYSFISSRLHFKSIDLFWFAIKTFPEVYKSLMEKLPIKKSADI